MMQHVTSSIAVPEACNMGKRCIS